MTKLWFLAAFTLQICGFARAQPVEQQVLDANGGVGNGVSGIRHAYVLYVLACDGRKPG